MVKHNNVIPNIHFHKKHIGSSRGPLKARLALDQASKKKSRRLARAARAAAIAPRPLKTLKPIVRCPTQKHSAKTRLGRGFTLQEIKAAGMTPKYARTVGIAVDHRRQNKSAESLNANVERLKAYQAKLVVFPRKRLSSPKNGDASLEECKAASQLSGVVMPLVKAPKEIEMMEVTSDLKDFEAFTTMRVARKETKIDGYRIAVENRKKQD